MWAFFKTFGHFYDNHIYRTVDLSLAVSNYTNISASIHRSTDQSVHQCTVPFILNQIAKLSSVKYLVGQ